MQKILNKITEKLKKFIKSDSEMKTKGIMKRPCCIKHVIKLKFVVVEQHTQNL